MFHNHPLPEATPPAAEVRAAPDPSRKAALLYAWRCGLSAEEVELDLKWRAVFGCPLPILGDPKTVRQILAQGGGAGR